MDFFVPCYSNLVGALIRFSVPLAKTFLAPLATIASASTIDGAIQNDNKIHERGDVWAGKGVTWFILNEDVNDIIKIIQSIENWGVLLDGVSETVKR